MIHKYSRKRIATDDIKRAEFYFEACARDAKSRISNFIFARIEDASPGRDTREEERDKKSLVSRNRELFRLCLLLCHARMFSSCFAKTRIDILTFFYFSLLFALYYIILSCCTCAYLALEVRETSITGERERDRGREKSDDRLKNKTRR